MYMFLYPTHSSVVFNVGDQADQSDLSILSIDPRSLVPIRSLRRSRGNNHQASSSKDGPAAKVKCLSFHAPLGNFTWKVPIKPELAVTEGIGNGRTLWQRINFSRHSSLIAQSRERTFDDSRG